LRDRSRRADRRIGSIPQAIRRGVAEEAGIRSTVRHPKRPCFSTRRALMSLRARLLDSNGGLVRAVNPQDSQALTAVADRVHTRSARDWRAAFPLGTPDSSTSTLRTILLKKWARGRSARAAGLRNWA